MKKTNRGFPIYTEFKDSYQQEVRVQQSSSMERAHAWIFCKKDGQDGVFHLGRWQSYSPHLTVAQAKRVRMALKKFIQQNSREERSR